VCTAQSRSHPESGIHAMVHLIPLPAVIIIRLTKHGFFAVSAAAESTDSRSQHRACSLFCAFEQRGDVQNMLSASGPILSHRA
jgi:hypothetical protein